MATILVIHGPNLNMLGKREPDLYGTETLDDINKSLTDIAVVEGFHLKAVQSNAEHELIEAIHEAAHPRHDVCSVIINPAAFTHTSIALRDALLASGRPYYEVHISNVHAREPFRHHSYFSDKALAVICGLGSEGYRAALRAAIARHQQQGAQ
jgi:3-dehydroquinate dehydratase-2